MTFSLSDFTIADYDGVLHLWQTTPGVGLSPSDTRKAIAAYLERNPGFSQVARSDEGRIVGVILCGHDGARGYIRHLAVAEKYQRQGLGRRLVEASLAKLKASGIYKCTVFTFTDNSTGNSFWQILDWTSRVELNAYSKILE